ncbi:MAG: hypothetical protein MZV64_59500 [Ignavibacteriales bacterium]|nr:hypothetical protein [Ignavibacteriales bacterium]
MENVYIQNAGGRHLHRDGQGLQRPQRPAEVRPGRGWRHSRLPARPRRPAHEHSDQYARPDDYTHAHQHARTCDQHRLPRHPPPMRP